MKKCFVITLFILLIVNTYTSHAKSLISSSNCIIGFQPKNNSIISLKTVSQSCYNKCNQYCLNKFKLLNDGSDGQDASSISTDKNLMIFRSGVLNGNKDRLESCVSSCYNNTRFDTKVRIPIRIDANSGKSIDDNGKIPYPWRCDIKTNASSLQDLSCNYPSDNFPEDLNSLCSGNELDAAFYPLSTSFQAGDKLSVSLSNLIEKNVTNGSGDQIITTEDNNIYLCGFKTVFFSPEYFVKDQSFKGDTPTNTIFSSRNNSSINTGIKVKNNDYLKIQYIGRYNSSCPNNKCTQNDQDYKLGVLIGSTKIDFDVSPYQLNDYDYQTKKDQSKKCQQQCSDSQLSICNSPQCGYYESKDSNDGLSVNTFWLSSPELFKVQSTSSPTYSQFRSTVLSGNIQNVSDQGQDLIIEYPNASSNSQGGYFVAVEWRGCNYKNGERIQYTIVNEALYNSFDFDAYMISPNGPKWNDLVMKQILTDTYDIIDVSSDSLKIPTGTQFSFETDGAVNKSLPQDPKDYKGRIIFRIKTLDQSEASYLNDIDRSRANTAGGYNIKVVDLSDNKGLLDDVVESFIKFLQDQPQNIFNGFKNSTEYLIIIRLLLTFYIAFTGLSFMVGLSQLTQQEAVTRVFKIAVVLMLFTENSFEFFNNYLFRAFSFTSINFLTNVFTPEVDMNMARGLTANTSNCFAPGVPIKMLCVLQKDLQLFFQWDFWNRIIGMAFSGFFIAAIAITIGIIMYATVILKVTALYCISLLATTITLSLAPIFLPLMLFKYTKSFFDSWIKQLISLLLQPVFLFLSISLFRILFILLVQSLMGNSACRVCWIEFFTWCWIEVYVPLSLSSSPSFASMPMSNIGMLLAFYFVGHGMYSFCKEATEMGKRMISFSLFNIGSARVDVKDMYSHGKQFGSMTYNIATAPLDVLAVDDKSMDQRQELRGKRRDEQNNDHI